ncbi:probable glucan endo-1,3-beta-glucosidase At4g16260 [Argentina anserina]|uniref:probable glucan endo-1,3-beta-glucosidase At4g16260 n=1 Tax=Argentina anserina TaxID=57926 RepID=UPI0021762798|nr:probable glucan endo-1,3-beta-glucosidase At4g16260 [Potentilla anserina]
MPKNNDHHYYYILLSHISLFLLNLLPLSSSVPLPVGICYGRVANNLPPPTATVDILKANNITNVRLFNTDPAALSSFSNTGISVMIGVPNEILPSLTTASAATEWLQSNIFAIIPANQVRYIAVGNEVFNKDPYYTPHVVPAMHSLHQALQTLNLSLSIKLSSPQAASVLSNSFPSSSGLFDPELKPFLLPLLQFLHDTASPFMVNLYPYFSYLNNRPYISVDYALFRDPKLVHDGALVYDNLFDASVDAFVSALEKEGFGDVEVVVSETGWPTSGGEAASVENALAYNREVVRRAAEGVGTPKKAGVGLEVYLFDLFDENEKGGEEYERHFGIFGLDGFRVYDLTFN